ncbi:MAG TPA: hypothetical protein VN924_14025 [Bryobacteraceae bacterium]|nr:hypothetical protein [Bryobacteraceae bacterium]
MFSRRQLFYLAAAGPVAASTSAKITAKQRVDRALKGQGADRTQFT